MYAEPGALVIRLVRKTSISFSGTRWKYKFDEVQEQVCLFGVSKVHHYVMEKHMPIMTEQDTMTLVRESVVYLPPSPYRLSPLQILNQNLNRTNFSSHIQNKSRAPQNYWSPTTTP
jgi:hypothetical protein